MPSSKELTSAQQRQSQKPEDVDDGETGFLSAVGDVDKMADDAARLLMDEKLRREMGRHRGLRRLRVTALT